MEERDWLLIKVLHEQRNITKAAQKLFISQPSLTARIRQIEADFGIKMIYRGNRGIHFTPEGDYLAQCSDTMLANIREIRERVLSMGSAIKGTLRLGASNYVIKYKLPRILRLFKDCYPEVEFNVRSSWSKEIFSMMYNQDLHIGFVRTDYGWQEEKQLLFEETICIASKDPIQFSELPRLHRIEYRTDPQYKDLLDNWWNSNFSQSPKVIMSLEHLDMCKDMVVNGLGYAIMPSTIFSDTPYIHKINLQDKQGKPIIRKTWMIYHKEALELKVVNAFTTFIRSVDFHNI